MLKTFINLSLGLVGTVGSTDHINKCHTRGCITLFLWHDVIMKNTHLQHPEDSILTGDLTALDWLLADGDLSVKIDGAPAIVWGTNPATGNFFVGTKSVFNKVKIKINETHDDIDRIILAMLLIYYTAVLIFFLVSTGLFKVILSGLVVMILLLPNTITYIFDEITLRILSSHLTPFMIL